MTNSHTKPANEVERLAVLRRYEILDTPPDGNFDRITAIAARLFDVPISIISLVDNDRIWFKSHHGLPDLEISRDPGLCASAILKNEPHIISDAFNDPRALSNPLIAGKFGLRFYAGVPLHTHDGYNLGTLCVIDRKARKINHEKMQDLQDLAQVVMDQMELRISAKNALSAKDNLLKEMNHRIGNSLQMVSNFLMIEGIESDLETSKYLLASAERVACIGRVHHKLSQIDQFSTMEFKEYLIELLDDICQSLLTEGITCNLSNKSEVMELPSHIITVLGIIINELVTNIAKHAYPIGMPGKIFVKIGTEDNKYYISVSDEGVGTHKNVHTEVSLGIGTKLIKSLVEQIQGEIISGSSKNNTGFETKVFFPKSGI